MHKPCTAPQNRTLSGDKDNHIVAVGFDGCVDLIAKPVQQVEKNEKKFFSTIDEFGKHLIGKAGLSCSLDIEKITEKAGGNMPLFACALSTLGVVSDCIGSLGYPEPQEIFNNLGKLVKITSVIGAATCTSLEFDDGKVMLGCNGDVDKLDFETLKSRVGVKKLQSWLENADAAAFLNWSELPGCTSIWKGLLEEVLPSINNSREKWLMLDISDCSRRTSEEIREMLSLMCRFNKYYKVVFSLNYNESLVICDALGLSSQTPEQAASLIFESINIELLVLHLLNGAVCVDNTDAVLIPAKRVDKPFLSTGGGDNFNAGLLWSLLSGLSHKDAVSIANTVSGIYVTQGKSPSAHDVQMHRTQQ